MSSWIFEIDPANSNYVNFNGGGGLWRLHKNSVCISWRYDESGDLFFAVYDQYYTVKAADIGGVVVGGVTLTQAADFETNIKIVFPGLDNSGGGGGSSYLSAEYTLDNDEIIGLRTTPVDIVPAQGSGKIILAFLAYIVTDFSAGVYGNRVNASIQLGGNEDGSFSDLSSPLLLNGALGTTNRTIIMFSLPYTYSIGEDPFYTVSTSYDPGSFSGYENCPLAIKDVLTSGSGNYTGGNEANTMKVVVHYIVVDVS